METPTPFSPRLARRIFTYTNEHTNYRLNVEGQEDIMSIQYTGMGKNSKEARDRYMPHCDGDCQGGKYVPGGRVATMLMYCAAPDLGGNTNFRNANVQVKPVPGSATWFTYASVEHEGGKVTGGTQDEGLSEHSGCPVVEGTKKILTLWMRAGVSREEPWNSFDTRGLKKGEVEKFKERVEGFEGGGKFGDEL